MLAYFFPFGKAKLMTTNCLCEIFNLFFCSSLTLYSTGRIVGRLRDAGMEHYTCDGEDIQLVQCAQ